jgi:hypothetical protein
MIPLGRATPGSAPGILYSANDEERDDHLAHALDRRRDERLIRGALSA